ncbi:MAG: transpeptidase family protein [Phormidesmis sp. FL-bin-119]|nr:transpeptidase family protein [Pedobacter sp.]
MNIRTDILLRVYIAFGLIVLLAFAVLFKLFHVQYVEGSKWRSMADSLSTRFANVEAARGNIYAADGKSLLATSVPEYEVRMDMLAGGIEKDEIFYEKIDSLAAKLSVFFGDKSTKQYSRMLRNAREDKSRYLLLKRNVTHQELKAIRRFPVFNMGRYKGGLISVQQNKRIMPFQSLAARTIGYKNENVQPVGLEGAYSSYIDGESGKRLVQRIAGGIWMPVNQDIEIAAKEGADIISTIDINMQDVAQRALKKQLILSNADHGTVILMEVTTGEVRAIANFSKVSEGVYKEKFNYAIAGNQDPGSTFKVASYMALLEDKKVDTNTMVGTGTYPIPGKVITDSHGSIGIVTVKRAFEESSNAAVAQLVNTAYKSDQSKFTDHLYRWHLHEKLGLQIPGEAQPVIKNPKNKSWNKNMTLPQMAYGYEMQLTPLKLLSFYNAIANNGKYIAPIFVKEIKRLGNTVEQFKARVISEKICSDETLGKMRAMLEGVITNGTGKTIIKSPFYRVAGKSGTAQVADGNKGYKAKRQYQASFCGYFPADNPKYSLIVVINDPRNGYYGALVSGPVFREVADRVYASDISMFDAMKDQKLAGNIKMPSAKVGEKKATQRVYKAFGIKTLFATNAEYVTVDTNKGVVNPEIRIVEGSVPDVSGMGLKDALYVLGNSGLRPIVRGSGKVMKQSIIPGTKVAKGYPIVLELN